MSWYDKTFNFTDMLAEDIRVVLQKNNIVLTVDEALIIQNKFLKRPPTLTECLLWSIQCSEHCSYKSSRKFLKNLPTLAANVILGPKEDAGIVAVAKDNDGIRYGIVMSHESHNHPSQIVPFEGAATGVGGNVRDVCCMGAQVIAVADGLRFGDINLPKTGYLHNGVVLGIASYANALGVPNIIGDVDYNKNYNDNCLVTVTTLGIVREDEIIHSYAPKNANNYDLILVGKATDQSGFAGASFASVELADENKEQNRSAVQEPNAFLGRHLLKANYILFNVLKEKKLLDKVGFKDLGAGGIACASVELADAGGYGAFVNLDLVPVSQKNLHPAIILCSETQERYMWVVPAELTNLILQHYNETFALPKISQNACATVIGKITLNGNYVVTYDDYKVVDAKACDITKGIMYDRIYCEDKNKNFTEPDIKHNNNYNEILLQLLAHEIIASREIIFEKYDKQVQGRTVIERSNADAGVMQPFNSDDFPKEIQTTGIALSVAQNPRYGKIDSYWCAVNAIVKAACEVAAVGATPEAITDCLCFGNPEKPEQMFDFVMACNGIKDACNAIFLTDYINETLPVISGNVSFYNESKNGAIPASPMISCLGKLKNVACAINYNFKKTDSIILLVGEIKNNLGGSAYYSLFDKYGVSIPKPNLKNINNMLQAVIFAIGAKLILSAKFVSDGGLAIALCKMSFANNIGLTVKSSVDINLDAKLFSEMVGFVVEVAQENLSAIEDIFLAQNIFYQQIGRTNSGKNIELENCINLPIKDAKKVWQNGLRDKLL